MEKIRIYGSPPYSVAVVHGGPGARGDMMPVARELVKTFSVLEPLQTAVSINGQVKELYSIIKRYADIPIILIGHSWGAWLSYIFTARYPTLVKKLILLSSGPFEVKFVPIIMKTRLNRLNQKERKELNTYIALMNNQIVSKRDIERLTIKDNDKIVFTKFIKLMSKTDSYRPVISRNKIDFRLDIMQGVWQQADELRRSGKLLDFAKKIICPVTAIHGDYDPHQYQGVKKPLSKKIRDFRFLLLRKCGHCPWIEKYAKEKFYDILIKELTSATDRLK